MNPFRSKPAKAETSEVNEEDLLASFCDQLSEFFFNVKGLIAFKERNEVLLRTNKNRWCIDFCLANGTLNGEAIRVIKIKVYLWNESSWKTYWEFTRAIADMAKAIADIKDKILKIVLDWKTLTA